MSVGSPQELPYNLEAEQSVLGAILVDPDCLAVAMQYLRPESFFRQTHREIFAVMTKMFLTSSAVDFITVLETVTAENIFQTPEDAKIYLAQLIQLVPTTANMEAYARIVQDKYYLRQLIGTFESVVSASREGGAGAAALMDMAEQGIYDIRQGREATGLTRIDDIILSTYDRLQRLGGEDRSAYLGIPTGFAALDTVIAGLNKTDLIFLAARPGMGKTSFALNVITHAAAKAKKTVAVFSLEMSKEQLVSRIISAEALVSGDRMRTGLLTPDDWDRIASCTQPLSKAPIYVDDSPGITVGEMKGKLRRLRELGLVVIDYVQLMSSGRRSENRVQEVSEITRSLKVMAKELNVPVLVLSQLSRGPEGRSDHRPLLSDLRESGSIEQDADVVMFLYRDSYYNRDSDEQNVAECIVSKNRHGETDTVKLGWDGQFTKFRNLELRRDER
jgi:replicative DNA helicase